MDETSQPWLFPGLDHQEAAESRPGGPGKARASKPHDERPYLWAARLALVQIQKKAGTGPLLANAIAAYIALAWIASERANTANVQAQVREVAGRIGLGYRSTWSVLKFLEEEARVIRAISPPGQHQGKIYQLLSMHARKSPKQKEKRAPLATHCKGVEGPTLATGCKAPLQTKGAVVCREVDKEEKPKAKGRRSPGRAQRKPGGSSVAPPPPPGRPGSPSSPDPTDPREQQTHRARLVVEADVPWEAIRTAVVEEGGEFLIVEIEGNPDQLLRKRIEEGARSLSRRLGLKEPHVA